MPLPITVLASHTGGLAGIFSRVRGHSGQLLFSLFHIGVARVAVGWGRKRLLGVIDVPLEIFSLVAILEEKYDSLPVVCEVKVGRIRHNLVTYLLDRLVQNDVTNNLVEDCLASNQRIASLVEHGSYQIFMNHLNFSGFGGFRLLLFLFLFFHH